MYESQKLAVIGAVGERPNNVFAEVAAAYGDLAQANEVDVNPFSVSELIRRSRRVRGESPSQHHAVPQIGVSVLYRPSYGVGEFLNIPRGGLRVHSGSAHPNRHAVAPAVNVGARSAAFHASRAVAAQDEIAEVGIGHPRNARGFVNAPLLYREIGSGILAHDLRPRLPLEARGLGINLYQAAIARQPIFTVEAGASKFSTVSFRCDTP